MNSATPLYISISGLIGAGKSTLATALGKVLDLPVYYEPIGDIEYLSDFYTNIAKYSFPMQIYLLNKRFQQQQQIIWQKAGAIQDRSRAPLIGELTFGKGSVQMPHNLSNGSQFRVTIARWYTPNDNTIHEQGLTPDIEAAFPRDTPAGQDPQLQRAIDYLLQGE